MGGKNPVGMGMDVGGYGVGFASTILIYVNFMYTRMVKTSTLFCILNKFIMFLSNGKALFIIN